MNIKQDGINFVWSGGGFGNALILAHLTKICVDNGIAAVFTQHKTTIDLVDVPLFNFVFHEDYRVEKLLHIRNSHFKKNCDIPCLQQYVNYIGELFNKKLEIMPEHDHIPVKYYDIKDIKGVDVALNTTTGNWSEYRNWPYFAELKELLNDNGISYIDLNENNIYGIECLNYVRKSRLYIGLETGMSHYVSKYANRKALIIQSGFCPFDYWAKFYHYDHLVCEYECCERPCFLTKKEAKIGIVCDNDHLCMRDIKPHLVIDIIKGRLRGEMIGRIIPENGKKR